MTLLINIQINLLFKRKFPIGLTSKFGNLVWPNARAALVLSVSPMFYTGFESLNSVDGLWSTFVGKIFTLGSREHLGTGPACRDGQLMNLILKIYLKGDGRIAAVRYHDLFIFLTK
jgi:hypothetical protein